MSRAQTFGPSKGEAHGISPVQPNYMTRRLPGFGTAILLVSATVAFAQHPKQNVSPARHPNIAAAQHLVAQANQRIIDAQKANEFDLAGHAEKARRLLVEADAELKAAAEAANRR